MVGVCIAGRQPRPKQFPGPVKPVRTTVGSDLAAGMRVEVTVVARRPGRAASAVTPAGR